MPDVLDVVEEATTFNHFNTPTNNPNDEMDEADMETNTTAKEVDENVNTNDMKMRQTWKQTQLPKRWMKMSTQMI